MTQELLIGEDCRIRTFHHGFTVYYKRTDFEGSPYWEADLEIKEGTDFHTLIRSLFKHGCSTREQK